MAETSPQAALDVDGDPGDSGAPLRPVQYLGNKQRSLPVILDAVNRLTSPGDGVADIFSGTSVVAQGMAGLNRQVMALDVAPSCGAMARASLGVGRPLDGDADNLVETIAEYATVYEDALMELFAGLVSVEDHAVATRDGEALIEVSRRIPQVWRDGSDMRPATLFEAWTAAADAQRYFYAVLSPVFAGTYLGLRQAITLDAHRAAVDALAKDDRICAWEVDVVLTALLAAASASSFSAGKHFAQPHNLDPKKDLRFHARRIVADRSVDVSAIVRSWIHRIFADGRSSEEGHGVVTQPVEDLTPAHLEERKIRLCYADPPYTAQQYSRFYHLLDTLVTGQPRRLQVSAGRVTGGLYPEGRFLSPFSSKRQAPEAFSNLARACHSGRASLLLSYSASSADSTGNARMITLPHLKTVVAEVYGSSAVEVVELQHEYRQFNRSDSARELRSDPEILVIAHAP